MTTATAISLEEYLNTSYEWEPEYVDGELIERPMPTDNHALVQHNIERAFIVREDGAFECRPGVRLPLGATRVRIPDYAVFPSDYTGARYPLTPPIAVIEILTPDDLHAVLSGKFNDYQAWGVRYSWLVDPERNTIRRIEDANWIRVDSIEIPDHGLVISAAEIFSRRGQR